VPGGPTVFGIPLLTLCGLMGYLMSIAREDVRPS
jgi:hypothetical protein